MDLFPPETPWAFCRRQWFDLQMAILRRFRKKPMHTTFRPDYAHIRNIKDLRECLAQWEEQYNAEPMNDVYLGKFEDTPIAILHYRNTNQPALYAPAGLGPVIILNNPHCLGIEFMQPMRDNLILQTSVVKKGC